MIIKLNGQNLQLADNLKVTEFLNYHLQGKEPRGIAVAVNDMIVPKSKWDITELHENDNIEIVHAVQGG